MERVISLLLLAVVVLVGGVMFLALVYQADQSRLGSGAPAAELPLLPPWTRLGFALDPDLVDLVAEAPYGCAGLVGASASVVSVGADYPLEVCGFSPVTRSWERVTDRVDLILETVGSGAVVVVGPGRVRAVASGRADLTARHGSLSASIRLQVLP